MADTFAEWSARIRLQVIPEREVAHLIPTHQNYIADALIDLQKCVKRLQQDHKTVIQTCDTYYNCGASVFTAPDRALIQKLYTVLSTNWCSKVNYEPVSKDQMDCLMSQVELPKQSKGSCERCYSGDYIDYLYYGDQYPDPEYAPHCRSDVGYFALHRSHLWVFPSFLPTENVVIEWDGIKRVWADLDVADFDREVEEAAEYYLRWKIKQHEDCDIDAAMLSKLDYEMKRRDLILQARREAELKKSPPCFSTYPGGQASLWPSVTGCSIC